MAHSNEDQSTNESEKSINHDTKVQKTRAVWMLTIRGHLELEIVSKPNTGQVRNRGISFSLGQDDSEEKL